MRRYRIQGYFGNLGQCRVALRSLLRVHRWFTIGQITLSRFLLSLRDIGFEKNMEANRSQGGIQLLLAAEQEAQHIVNAARNAKMARLKQAKEEAEKEIAEYRAQMEAEFQRKVAESSGDSGANVKRLEQETRTKIEHLKSESSRISHDVVQMLLRHVTTVKN